MQSPFSRSTPDQPQTPAPLQGTRRLATDFVGFGPRNYRRSDERILDDVADRLTEDARIDASDLEIEVRDGEVLISGMVANLEQKRRAEWILERVFGVRHVINAIRLADDRAVARSSILERHRR